MAKKTTVEKPEKSPLDRIRELDAERDKILSSLNAERDTILSAAKTEALRDVDTALERVNALGFNYVAMERGQASSPAGKGTRLAKDVPCPICMFKTAPLHDARSHRMQMVKKPFTLEELMAKGFTRV